MADTARDEHAIQTEHHICGYLGPWSSCFTLAWLASHRDRLRSLILGGKRLTILVVWDTAGTRDAARSDEDVDAIRTLVNGPESASGGERS